ncbi:MAG: cytochrome c oxidase assembly protein [Anaerolineae bacterium]
MILGPSLEVPVVAVPLPLLHSDEAGLPLQTILWVAGLAAVGIAYGFGLSRVRRSGRWQAVGAVRAAAFYLALLALAFTQIGPIATFADDFFWVHMVQHFLYWLAAPLILLGSPLLVAVRSTRKEWLQGLLPPIVNSGLVRRVLPSKAYPVLAWSLFVVTVTVWHLPGLYNATLENEAIHLVEHLSFLATSLLFWSVVIDPRPWRSHLSHAGRVIYLILAYFQSIFLGWLLTFSSEPWYPFYATLRQEGLSAVLDQNLGGQIMWIPGGMMYLLAILVTINAWLNREERTVTAQERAAQPRGTIQDHRAGG